MRIIGGRKARQWRGVLAVCAGLGLASAALGQIQNVKVAGGALQGVVKDGVASFKGIPFAAPPVGDLRWRAPQPVKPWSGVKVAEAFAPAPMQDVVVAVMMGGTKQVSEDCLYLNVWTAAKAADEKRPVMVWIYGGAFMSGMTSAPVYDGGRLAQKGVVVVSIAYRVGPFGFLAHPELSQESGKGSGCYGLMDQVAALRWVKENIAQFGGDPACVTIFGESAGGISVSMLTAIPAAKGLFQRAISQSGGSMGPIKKTEDSGPGVPALKLAEQAGQKFFEKLGVKDLAAARAKSAEEIQKTAAGAGLFWPVADGVVLLGDQYELFAAGKFHDTPVLAGTNSDEGAMFIGPGTTPEKFEKQIREQSGPAAEGLLKVYPHATDAEAFKSMKDVFRESFFAWPTWAWATLQTRKGRYKVFVYYYDHRTPTSPAGASHAAELPYVFGNLGGWGGGSRPEDKALSELMMAYWVNFAKAGDPNGAGLPEWPVFSPKEPRAMLFEGKSGAVPLPNLDKLEACDRYFAWRREQAKAGQ